MEKVLVVLRGSPNSGKSSFAKLLGRAICCADDWYIHKDNYKWDAKYLKNAHDWCQRKCERFMQKDVSPIIIANTNITENLMQPYISMAEEFGYVTYFIVIENRHGNKNSHNVPDETIEKMKSRLINSIKL
jgi:predicted kinase